MKIRRCAVLYLEPREELDIDWASLFAGGSTLAASLRWMALAPHLDREIAIELADVAALGAYGQTVWTERAEAEQRHGGAVIARLLELGLLLGDAPEYAAQRERDETLRSQHWRPMSALAHTYGRWNDVRIDTGAQFPSFQELLSNYGVPPAPLVDLGAVEAEIKLPAPAGGALDDTLLQRYTGRNFDRQATLPLALAARLLQRSFGAQQTAGQRRRHRAEKNQPVGRRSAPDRSLCAGAAHRRRGARPVPLPSAGARAAAAARHGARRSRRAGAANGGRPALVRRRAHAGAAGGARGTQFLEVPQPSQGLQGHHARRRPPVADLLPAGHRSRHSGLHHRRRQRRRHRTRTGPGPLARRRNRRLRLRPGVGPARDGRTALRRNRRALTRRAILAGIGGAHAVDDRFERVAESGQRAVERAAAGCQQ